MGLPSQVEGQETTPLRAVVVGGGPAGCVTAFFLAKRGFIIDLFERRSEFPRPQETAEPMVEEARKTVFDRSETRSYSMMLTKRALVALEAAGIELPPWIGQRIVGGRRVMPNGKVVKTMHGPGTDNRTVARQTLSAWLLYHLQDSFPETVKVHLGYGFVGLKERKRVALFERTKRVLDAEVDARSGDPSTQLREAPYDLLVGADGVGSGVRTHLLKKEEAEGIPPGENKLTCSQVTSVSLYKTLVVPSAVAKRHGFEGQDRLYINMWTCGVMMVPMSDGSLWGGSQQPKLTEASSAEAVESILRTEAPDLFRMLKDADLDFAQRFAEQTAIPQGTNTELSRFHSGHVVLVGDAAHSMYPTLGQGCNTAIEDCMVFDQALEATGVRGDGAAGTVPRALKEFTDRRLPDVRAIQALNSRSFFPRTMLDRVKLISIMLMSKATPFLIGTPSFFLLFSSTPFRRILAQKDREDRTWQGVQISAAVLGAGVATYALRHLGVV